MVSLAKTLSQSLWLHLNVMNGSTSERSANFISELRRIVATKFRLSNFLSSFSCASDRKFWKIMSSVFFFENTLASAIPTIYVERSRNDRICCFRHGFLHETWSCEWFYRYIFIYMLWTEFRLGVRSSYCIFRWLVAKSFALHIVWCVVLHSPYTHDTPNIESASNDAQNFCFYSL